MSVPRRKLCGLFPELYGAFSEWNMPRRKLYVPLRKWCGNDPKWCVPLEKSRLSPGPR